MPEDKPVQEQSQRSHEIFVASGEGLAKQFEFLEIIDSGGMGVIYKARNVAINQIVAIKMIQTSSIDDRHVQRFRQEAAALSHINHYHIVEVKDFGFADNSQPYMVLEFIDGLTLPQFLRAQPAVPLETLRLIFTQIADGLSHAHERGVLHRDLKPSNIMIKLSVDAAPIVKIIDFGIAKMLTAESNSAVTRTGEILGSPAYMSPEQISGAQQDARTDIYSFGCVMFEALAGVPPFQATNSMDLIFQQLNAEAPDVRTKATHKISNNFAAIIMRCLQKDPNHRFQSMADLEKALRESDLVEPPKSYFPLLKKSIIYACVVLMVFIASSLIYAMYEKNLRVEQKNRDQEKQTVAANLAAHDSESYAAPSEVVQKYIRNNRNQETMRILDSCNDEALSEFARGDYAAKTIKLANSDVKGSGLAYLIRLPLLRLEMQRSSVTDRGLLEISKMKTLKYLNLDATKITPTGINYLRDVPLTRLSVRDMNITDKGLENICKIATLESLQLDGNPEVTDEGYSQLPKLQRLGMLSLCTGVITNYLIQTLVQMPSLTKLYFNGNSLTDTQLRALGKSKTLTELHLENNNLMSVAGLKYILEMPQIRAVNLRGVKWLKDDDLKAFKLVDHKFHVGLEDTKVTDAGMKLIAQSNVASVDITRTTVTDIGLLDLAKAEHLKSIRINIGGSITPGAIKNSRSYAPTLVSTRK